MDLMTLLTAIPGVGPFLPYILVAVALCATLATTLPPPKVPASGFYPILYAVVNWIALNAGHAKNAGAQPSPPVPPVVLALLVAGLSLTACTTSQIQTTTTLATLAAANNTTAASIVAQGVLICQSASGLVAVASAVSTPASVVGQGAADVAAICAGLGAAPVALPVGVDPETVAVAVVAGALGK